MEPFFSVIMSGIFLGEVPPVPVLLTLIPIVGGVIMASLSEVSFNWTGEQTGARALHSTLRCVLGVYVMHSTRCTCAQLADGHRTAAAAAAGFLAALASNISFQSRNVLSKKFMISKV